MSHFCHIRHIYILVLHHLHLSSPLSVVEKLYQDFFEVFDNDLFHMGGDEVNANCWESELKWNKNDGNFDFISTWGKFQQEGMQ